MFLKRYFIEGLAHASYLFGAGGEAAVVDPQRDVERYLIDAERAGLRITSILNTHPHADFASGFPELAQRTGARVYTSHLAPVKYKCIGAMDGDCLRLGSLTVEILETPGHSPDSLSFLVREDGRPEALFTGDLLFVGDVGRPDLRDAEEGPEALAGKLYDSLVQKVLALPDEVKVHPAHGAGSLCGRSISRAPSSSIGHERRCNWALQIKDRAEFVKRMTTDLPDRPAYFAHGLEVNLRGARPLSDLPAPRPLREDELQRAAAAGAVVIDTRPAPLFGAGHFPGSLNISLESALFPTWVGFLVPARQPIAFVVGTKDDALQARLALARIGFDDVIGYVEADALTTTRQLTQLSAQDLKVGLQRGTAPLVLDIRAPAEWEKTRIEGALHIPLPRLTQRVGELPKRRPLAVVCASGYRSSIAASLLQTQGFQGLQNVMGGMSSYAEVDCPPLTPAGLVFGEGI